MKLNLLKHQVLIIGLLLSMFSLSRGQVVINEFCTANYNDWTVSGENEDWVELYNPTAAPIDISGYYLSDNPLDPQKWPFPAGSSVPANGYLMVLLSGTSDFDPTYLGYRNTNFKITQTAGESLLFSNTSGTVLEQFDLNTMGAFQANHSYARTTNGGATWAIHTDPSPGAGNSGANYSSYSTPPVFSQPAGYYGGPLNITLTAQPGCTIYYTTNGGNPTTASTLYTGPIAISTTTTIRARSYSSDTGVFQSLIETNTYFFGADQHAVITVNIAGPTLSDGQWMGNEACHIEFFAPGGVFITEAGGDSNEHGNDSNAYGQRGFDYVTRDAMGYDNEVEYPLFNTSDRPSFERLIFKAAANDNYPFAGGAHIRDAYVCQLSVLGNLHLDERKTESCIVYINGAYWGVYEYREKVDDIDYTDYYFDQPEGFVDFIKTWGGTWVEYGSNADWITLRNFVTSNDMTVQANYDYVLTQFNHMSLIDYFILNGYVVCTDWLNWNTAWWRGRHPNGDARRWRYALWDNDATFGHYINYTGVPSTGPGADPCQIDDMGNVGGQGHIPILNALFDNENFLADYVQRYASLSNSIFSCDRMIQVLDSMINVIDPEMTRQCQRWGGNYATWQNNVQEMRDFIMARCNDEIIGGLEDCYDVTAYNVTVQIDGVGEIEFATLDFNNSNVPFTGVYFADLPINMEAFVDDVGAICGSFAGWEIVSGDGVIANPNSPVTTLTIYGDVTIVAHFQDPAGITSILTTQLSEPDAGVITINGTPQTVYPNETTIVPGSEISLSVSANEWFVFDSWTSANSTTLTPDNTSTTITLSPCLSDSITAIFTEIPHFTLDIRVDATGGGTIVFDGITITTDGLVVTLEGGLSYGFTAVPENEWFVFSHWINEDGNIITPNDTDPAIFLQLMASGSLIAVFTEIPHFTLDIKVDEAGGGIIIFDNDTITTDGLVITLEAALSYGFTAVSTDEWSVFSHWETEGGNIISPSDIDPAIFLELLANGSLTAVFSFIPHHTITVLVDPPYAGGIVTFEENHLTGGVYTTDSELTVVLEGDRFHLFDAKENEFWNFSNWTSKYHTPSPDAKLQTVNYRFTRSDTVIAHFVKEDFKVFIPNSFTPNNDGKNDVFKIEGSAIDTEQFHMRIFNRWGDVVFESRDIDMAWVGDVSGGDYYFAQDQVYQYILNVKSVHEMSAREMTGTITIFR